MHTIQSITSSQSVPSLPPIPASRRPSTTREDVVPWEYHSVPPWVEAEAPPAVGGGRVRGISTAGGPSTSGNIKHHLSSQPGYIRQSLNTGLVEDVTPWELFPAPEDEKLYHPGGQEAGSSIQQKSSRSSARPASGGSSRFTDLARRRKSSSNNKSRSNTLPVVTPQLNSEKQPISYIHRLPVDLNPVVQPALTSTSRGPPPRSAPSTPKLADILLPLPPPAPGAIPSGPSVQNSPVKGQVNRPISGLGQKQLRAKEDYFTILGAGSLGLTGSRVGKKHHAFGRAAPYGLCYDRDILDLEATETLAIKAMAGSVSFIPFDTPPKKVLDLGCGAGHWILEAAEQWPDTHFVGLDLVPIQPNLHIVKKDLAPRIEWVHCNFLEELPFHDGVFDLVHVKRIAMGVPEDQWDSLLEEITRVMKPGGAFEMIDEDLFFPGKALDSDSDVESDYGINIFANKVGRPEAENHRSRATSYSTLGDGERHAPTMSTSSLVAHTDDGGLPPTPTNASLQNPTSRSTSPLLIREEPIAEDEAEREGAIQIVGTYHALVSSPAPTQSPQMRATRPPLRVKTSSGLIPTLSQAGHLNAPAAGAAGNPIPTTARPSSQSFFGPGNSLVSLLSTHSASGAITDASDNVRKRLSGGMGSLAAVTNVHHQQHEQQQLQQQAEYQGMARYPSISPQQGRAHFYEPHYAQSHEEGGSPPGTKTSFQRKSTVRTTAKAPLDPRNHSIIAIIYEECFEWYFINPSPLSIVANLLPLHFAVVQSHPPLQVAFPPPPPLVQATLKRSPTPPPVTDSDSDDARDAIIRADRRRNSRASTQNSIRQQKQQQSANPQAQSGATSPIMTTEQDGPQTVTVKELLHHSSTYPFSFDTSLPVVLSPAVKVTSPADGGKVVRKSAFPNRNIHIELKTAVLHMSVKVQTVIAMGERMYAWLKEFQEEMEWLRKQRGGEGPITSTYYSITRNRSGSIETNVGSSISIGINGSLISGTGGAGRKTTSVLMNSSGRITEEIKQELIALSRDDFDTLMGRFKLDMIEQMGLIPELISRFNWNTITTDPSLERKAFDKLEEKLLEHTYGIKLTKEKENDSPVDRRVGLLDILIQQHRQRAFEPRRRSIGSSVYRHRPSNSITSGTHTNDGHSFGDSRSSKFLRKESISDTHNALHSDSQNPPNNFLPPGQPAPPGGVILPRSSSSSSIHRAASAASNFTAIPNGTNMGPPPSFSSLIQHPPPQTRSHHTRSNPSTSLRKPSLEEILPHLHELGLPDDHSPSLLSVREDIIGSAHQKLSRSMRVFVAWKAPLEDDVKGRGHQAVGQGRWQL